MTDQEKLTEQLNPFLIHVEGKLVGLTLEMQKSDQKMVPPAHLNPKSSNHMDALAKTREAKIKRLQEIILEANLELARLKKKRRLE
ncbi:hypothetical protein ERO13_D04G020550v2 [Gossypium hirsutum]|nr:hypothetical protein ES319_D04G023100v1 [Gossypium barbadense]KAG4150727.1 hypothetical protein ERO13_D04G020550v2 [Gossypium hirsutum]PPD76254.1 hypothetical protein GOBAR_DD26817 [Gossypium barbadense]TYG72481.1 hypothetical protein ES288_D04G024400v1 [Gossypium darwinii]TYI85849.1 hypothetical protein E1A91_D04G024700v1 [Gossypium mustelinum]